MAQSKEDIYNQIIIEKETYPELNELNSSSLFSVWKRWAATIASVAFMMQNLWDIFRTEILDINAKSIVGTPSWYVLKAKQFQYGDNVTLIEGQIGYANIDATKQIIKRAAYSTNIVNFTDSNSVVIPISNTLIKVATTDGTGNIIALDAAQLLAFGDYIKNIVFAGSYISWQSNNTDYLKLVLNVYYNPLFATSIIGTAINVAVKNYLANLPFDGEVVKNKIIDVIQKIDGVEDAEITISEARTNLGTFTPFTRNYSPVAGYIEIDAAHSILNNITYIVN
jgi:hypothetical protein